MLMILEVNFFYVIDVTDVKWSLLPIRHLRYQWLCKYIECSSTKTNETLSYQISPSVQIMLLYI